MSILYIRAKLCPIASLKKDFLTSRHLFRKWKRLGIFLNMSPAKRFVEHVSNGSKKYQRGRGVSRTKGNNVHFYNDSSPRTYRHNRMFSEGVL